MRVLEDHIQLTTSLLILFILWSCQTEPRLSSLGGLTDVEPTSSFAGIEAFDSLTRSSVRLRWTPMEEAVAYDIFLIRGETPEILTTVQNGEAADFTVTGLEASTSYTFRVRAKNKFGINDSNAQNLTVMTLAAAPSLAFLAPSRSPSLDPTPSFSVSELVAGDAVTLFRSDNCTDPLVSATATGPTITLKSSSLLPGVHSFSVQATTLSGTGPCSTTTLSYELKSCPPGYIPVPFNETLGVTEEFCVMKYEAKTNATSVISKPQSLPLTNLTRADAYNLCAIAGAELISNAQWMAIAAEIEATPENWNSGIVGQGQLFKGHTDNAPASLLAVTDPMDPFTGTGNSALSGKENQRVLKLRNQQEIWDFSGNAAEWINWGHDAGALLLGPTYCVPGRKEFPAVTCNLDPHTYKPLNPGGVSAGSYNSSYGLGVFFAGTGGSPYRGGGYSSDSFAGIYALDLSSSPGSKNTAVGFRCVTRMD